MWVLELWIRRGRGPPRRTSGKDTIRCGGPYGVGEGLVRDEKAETFLAVGGLGAGCRDGGRGPEVGEGCPTPIVPLLTRGEDTGVL